MADSGGGYFEAMPRLSSEIYWFQGVFMPERVVSPPLERTKFKPPPGQIPEYAPV